MKQNDRDSLSVLLNQTYKVYQNISRQIDWTTADSERLDDFADSREWVKDVQHRINDSTVSKVSAELIPFFIIYKAWQRTKAVYSFNKELVDGLSRTEDAVIYTYLLKCLPFKDMLFFFPEGVLPFIDNEEIAGMYVHIEMYPEQLWIVFNCLNRTHDKKILPGIRIPIPITNEMKVSQVFETSEYERWRSSYNIMAALSGYPIDEQRIKDLMLAETKVLNTAIYLLYYLSSKKPDIKEIKNHKKTLKAPLGIKEDKAPAVDLREVGAKYEIIYRRWKENASSNDDIGDDTDDPTEKEASTRTGSGKKRRPHPRKGHFQTYWTGKGRTIPEVLWIPDMFVGANQNDLTAFVYADVGKSIHKGKRNPNTNKKKGRNKT